jgi:CBS domain-containing protein
MSPRAAWRLESLGFKRVFDYVAGKSDWSARALPIEGEFAQVAKAADAAKQDVATCSITDLIDAVRNRLEGAGELGCIVVNDQNVVLGRLRPTASQADGTRRVEDLMEVGPSTFRAGVPLSELLERMQTRRVQAVIITDPDGRLVGVLEKQRAEELTSKSAAT